MKVREVIGNLQKCDPEADVVVAELMRVPSFGTVGDAGVITEPEEGESHRIASMVHYPIESTCMVRSLQDGSEVIVLEIDPAEVVKVEEGNPS